MSSHDALYSTNIDKEVKKVVSNIKLVGNTCRDDVYNDEDTSCSRQDDQANGLAGHDDTGIMLQTARREGNMGRFNSLAPPHHPGVTIWKLPLITTSTN